MSQLIEMRVPDMGNFKDVAVIDVLVKPGDAVQIETPLATLETEKATMDVPATAAGVIEIVHVVKGATINPGDLVVTVRAADAVPETAAAPAAPGPAAAAPPPAAPMPAPAAPVAAQAAPAPATPAPAQARLAQGAPAPIDEAGFARAYASPSVRKLARELGVDLGRVTGSGPKSRITADDVKAYVKRALAGGGAAGAALPGGSGLPVVPAVDFAAFGAVEVKPLGRIQKISSTRLHASWVNLPHVTQFDEADITDLEATREKLKAKAAKSGVKLTPLAFIVRACVRTLQHFPIFNASLDESRQNLVYKKYFHIGFAADTPNGLLVPVVRDADRKDIYEIARALAELAARARDGKLPAADMQGGSFTISSLGGIGGTAFTPIINAPEVAILGVSRSSLQPVYREGGFVPRLMLPLSLSYDHRVIDGAAAARFTTYLAAQLANPQALLEAVP
ncbi:MAG TPA: dihydrolipoyllysine-residue acetyltransferase [Steroidobacteraceae bacterium]|nr:dihydrolipoyllysine-residue acetyltransferase [Steroidobacteraceae bacterium]HQX46051.1 dihydrolipoyllysine-residue acetyltransferase [Steroidobacteraceae bacterium]